MSVERACTDAISGGRISEVRKDEKIIAKGVYHGIEDHL